MSRVYPKNWDRLAEYVKSRAAWRCERCGHPHDPAGGYTLTVAHLDHRLGNQRFNLAALCQRCHCKYEHRFDWAQGYLFEHSEWLKPHLAGYELWAARRAAVRSCAGEIA